MLLRKVQAATLRQIDVQRVKAPPATAPIHKAEGGLFKSRTFTLSVRKAFPLPKITRLPKQPLFPNLRNMKVLSLRKGLLLSKAPLLRKGLLLRKVALFHRAQLLRKAPLLRKGKRREILPS